MGHARAVTCLRQNRRMIDWPNALVGFLLGVLATLAFWLIDRGRAKRQRRQDAMDSWKGAAKEIELLTFKADTTAADLYTTRVRYPIDTWRSVLGPESFRLLERLEGTYHTSEHLAQKVAEGDAVAADVERLQGAVAERREAILAFANFSRLAQSEGYHEVVSAEERKRTRRDYLRHPIKTQRRQWHNRRMRKSLEY